MLLACFQLKFKSSNWKNTAQFLCESVHILICSVPSCIIKVAKVAKTCNLLDTNLYSLHENLFLKNAQIRITHKRNGTILREMKFATRLHKILYFRVKMQRNEGKNLQKYFEQKPYQVFSVFKLRRKFRSGGGEVENTTQL